MKYKKVLIFTLLTVIYSKSTFAEQTALKDILKQRADIQHEAEQNSASLKNLNDEKRSLIDKLVNVEKRYDEVVKTQGSLRKPSPVSITQAEIRTYITGKQMDRCRITNGDLPGEYIIEKDKVKIRFAFLPENSVLAPQLSLIKDEQNDDILQIEQPGYDPNATNLTGYMHSIMRFKITSYNTPGEVTHAFFAGQRINDLWFGRSSLTETPITCVMGRL